MIERTATDRYRGLTIALHWFMLLLIAAVYITIEFRGYFPRGSDARAAMKTWHFMLGLSVLCFVIVRIVARLAGATPEIQPSPPAWQMWLAKLLHLALYGLMIGMPIAGWVILSAEGNHAPFFGLELPLLVAKNHDLAESVEHWHKTFGTVGYYLIGLHAVAALFHHYIVRDNTLRRMLPRR